VHTVVRVLYVNSEIMSVSLLLVIFLLLFTSALLWFTASPAERAANNITGVPSAMYLAVLMLTGQGTPEGELQLISKCVVVITAFLSVPFFAVPAAMLTWGFEGEAERLVQRHRKHHVRQMLYGDEVEEMLSSSSDDDEDTKLEDYLDLIGGAEDDDAPELEVRALSFFQESQADTPLLPRARTLAAELEAVRLQKRNEKMLQADALTLLGQVATAPELNTAEWQDRAENRLRLFRERVVAENQRVGGSGAEAPGVSVEGELQALRLELSALRREIGALRA
jgi:hypothetical protein